MSKQKQKISDAITKVQSDDIAQNLHLISNDNPYQLVCIKKLDKIPSELEISSTLSFCTASLRVAEGQIGTIVLDNDSSNEQKYIGKYENTVEKLASDMTISENDRMCIEYVTFCDKWGHYTGVSEKTFFPNKNETPEEEKIRFEMERAEDSCNTQPFLLIGSVKEFLCRNYYPDEIKVLIAPQKANNIFGSTSKPVLIGLNSTEHQKYMQFQMNPEEGQAFCRQTTARIYGTNGPTTGYDGKPSELNIAQICTGARIRTTISFEHGETDTLLDPEKVYILSFSGRRFEQLFGDLKDIMKVQHIPGVP